MGLKAKKDIKTSTTQPSGNSIKKIIENLQSPFSLAVKIVIPYIISCFIWILATDWLLTRIVHITSYPLYQIFKEIIFIAVTSVILILYIRDRISEEHKLIAILKMSIEQLENANDEISASRETLSQQLAELDESRRALGNIEERYRLAIEGANDGIWDFDMRTGRFIFPRTKELLGYNQDEIEDTIEALEKLIHPEDIDALKEAIANHINHLTPYYKFEYRLLTKSGEYKWIQSRGKAIFDNEGKPVRMSGSHRDITDRKKSEEKNYYLAYYDSLTGLPNRTLFEDRLNIALAQCKRNGLKAAVMYIDLDNFKDINDTFGHAMGDAMLKSVAKTLGTYLREMDTVARLGGDEFALLIVGLVNRSDLLGIVERILRSFRKAWELEGHEFYITASIGIAFYPDDGEDPQTIFKNADTAMYSAKGHGKNCYYFYTREMNAKIMERLDIERKLRHAIGREELVLYYQPQIEIRSGKLIGVEALVRWITADGEVISPDRFIPYAEETGLIHMIGEWVLKTACRQWVIWQDKGMAPVRISVNISARQLQKNITQVVSNILASTGADPRMLDIEITESTAMRDLDLTISILNKLKETGVSISLDDFGTGYSSLNYLKRLPIDILKIDKTFVHEITGNASEEAIARTVIALAHSMKLRVVAEGVETIEQVKFLDSECCDFAQGYIYSRPLPASEVEAYLRAGRIQVKGYI